MLLEELQSYWTIHSPSCVTHFDITEHSFKSPQATSHYTSPHLQRINLRSCHYCLQSLKGLRTIANHCHSLQGLNLLGIHVSKVENLVLLWETLSDMELTHFAMQFCILRL